MKRLLSLWSMPSRLVLYNTVKFLNFWMPENCFNLLNIMIQTKRPNLRVFRQKDANGIANSEDPDQTAPLGAIGQVVAMLLGMQAVPRLIPTSGTFFRKNLVTKIFLWPLFLFC